MADLSDSFQKFEKEITLSPTDIMYLRKSRKAIVEKLKKHFKEELNLPLPVFIGQGSFSVGTIVKPLNGDYDIDIGVYLQGYSNWQSDWPKPETASNWLKTALENHTSVKPINKSTCVRIIYKPVQQAHNINYHVDLPIYIQYENLLGIRHTRIGLNGLKQWSEKSDPRKFTEWFKEICQKNENDRSQFVRIVKYLKAWKDYMKNKDGKMPNGMILTVLAGRKYTPHIRDDVAFYETIRKIYNKLDWSYYIEKPVQPYNNLGSYLDRKQWGKFMIKLGNLVDDAKKATSEDYDEQQATKCWSNHFDYRFK